MSFQRYGHVCICRFHSEKRIRKFALATVLSRADEIKMAAKKRESEKVCDSKEIDRSSFRRYNHLKMSTWSTEKTRNMDAHTIVIWENWLYWASSELCIIFIEWNGMEAMENSHINLNDCNSVWVRKRDGITRFSTHQSY